MPLVWIHFCPAITDCTACLGCHRSIIFKSHPWSLCRIVTWFHQVPTIQVVSLNMLHSVSSVLWSADGVSTLGSFSYENVREHLVLSSHVQSLWIFFNCLLNNEDALLICNCHMLSCPLVIRCVLFVFAIFKVKVLVRAHIIKT